MRPSPQSPFYRNPDHPCFNRRAFHHDYNRPARYLITILKNPAIKPFSSITGNPYSKDSKDIAVNLSRTGKTIPDVISNWQFKYPIIVEQYSIMPDHLHLCMNVAADLPNGLSRAIGNLMGMISKAHWLSIPEEKRPPQMPSMFSKGFNDRIAYTAQQWHRQLQYTADNPRRHLIKKLYPDFLLKRWLLKMPDGRSFILRGNIFLLRQPCLFRVKTSRRFTESEAKATFEDWKRALHNGAVPVSPFIHPHEKSLRDYAVENGFAYIRVCTNGFAERDAPRGKEFELMSAGRLLHIAPVEFNSQKTDLKYSFAQELNRLALEVVNICNSGRPLAIRALN